MLFCGVDIGGTFTDLVVFDPEGSLVMSDKLLTTHDDPSRAVASGLASLVARLNGSGSSPDARLVHATTLVTNAVIERTGAKTALLTTAGFRDVLDLRRENRFDIFDVALRWPESLVPLDLRWEVAERMAADGTELQPLDPGHAMALAEAMREAGVESVAIVFLHAYAFAEHEEKMRDALAATLPGVSICISSEVAPQIREFERSSTTVVNAYTMPLASGYLDRLSAEVLEVWSDARVSMMVSNGGTCSIDTARRFPVRLLESGPAAGTIAAQYWGRQTSEANVLAFDMGGTTAKLSIIRGGEPSMTTQFETAHVSRFKKGSGIPVSIPSIDLVEIGAGGGSVAEVDELGLLQVGPRSAGSDPGPACYGFGGADPTVTDADLALGYLDPDYFLGGSMALHPEQAVAAIERHVAERLDLSVLRAAWGIHDLVNENMAVAARLHLAGAGLDPRQFRLVVTGGAGPLHAVHLAAKLEIKHVICPPVPGIGSAYGLIVAPPRADVTRSFLARLDQIDWGELNLQLEELSARAVGMLDDARTASSSIERVAEMSYVGQTHHIEVPLPQGQLSTATINALRAAFDERYDQLYGITVTDGVHEIVGLRVTARGEGVVAPPPTMAKDALERRATSRPMCLAEGRELTDVPIRYRSELAPGAVSFGPAVIAGPDSSLVVDEGWEYWADEMGVLHVVDNR